MIIEFFKSINRRINQEYTIHNVINTRCFLHKVIDERIYHCKTIHDVFKKFDERTDPPYNLEQYLWSIRLLINNDNWNESRIRLKNKRKINLK